LRPPCSLLEQPPLWHLRRASERSVLGRLAFRSWLCRPPLCFRNAHVLRVSRMDRGSHPAHAIVSSFALQLPVALQFRLGLWLSQRLFLSLVHASRNRFPRVDLDVWRWNRGSRGASPEARNWRGLLCCSGPFDRSVLVSRAFLE